MFRKLVSNLPFSPALMGRLGSYARRLKKERAIRRLGLIFTVLALIMQSFSMFSPPEQALGNSRADIIPGGISSQEEILSIYDNRTQVNDFKDLIEHFGITRAELSDLELKTICFDDESIINFSRQHIFSASEGELAHSVPSQARMSTFYSIPLSQYARLNGGTFCAESFVGNSTRAGWFAIAKKSGNLQLKQTERHVARASFTNASCKSVQGFAYDERQPSLATKVHLFIGGPPGKGDSYGPIPADQVYAESNHGFSFNVPEIYLASKAPIQVWGVMQSSRNSTQTTISMTNTATIPGNCAAQTQPIVECNNLTIDIIDKRKFRLTTHAHAEYGAKIESYTYSIRDVNGRVVFDKSYPSNQVSLTTDTISLDEGIYSAKSHLKTNIGNIEDLDCIKNLSLVASDKCQFNTLLKPEHEDCQPCPYDSSLWIKSDQCVMSITSFQEVHNLTKNRKDANNTTFQAGDRIEYVFYTLNVGNQPIITSIRQDLSDVLEYASIYDNGGGSMRENSKTLSWDNVTLQPGQTDIRRVNIVISEKIATTPLAGNNPSSYNCIMTHSYGNTIHSKVECPASKAIEMTIQKLPPIGTGGNIIFASTLLTIATYFYVRSRQLTKEIQLIRKEFGSGL